MRKQLDLTRKRLEELRQYAIEYGNLDTLRRYALKHGNLDTIRQLTIAPKSVGRKLLTSLMIAMASTLGAVLLSLIPPFNGVVRSVDESIYDSFYRRRVPESKFDGDVIIVAVDQSSIDRMVKGMGYRWPWPRDDWAAAIDWLQKCGAKVVVFDLLFEEPSYYQRYVGDDTSLAHALDSAKVPIVIAQAVPPEGAAPFALPTTQPTTFGAVNLAQGTIRTYRPVTRNVDSLAVAALRKANLPIPGWADRDFLLHYYGPTRRADGKSTFHEVPALEVLLASQPDAPQMPEIRPDLFRNKIVVIGATANATFDVKSSPLENIFPGTEVQATAMMNLIENRHVIMLGWLLTLCAGFVAAMFSSSGAVVPKRAWMKLLIPALAIAATFFSGYLLFVRFWHIYWLPLAVPLFAALFAMIAGVAWTYLVEGRQRRTLRKFLAQYVSPEVAAELDKRGTISLGGVEREMSVVFTDIAGFTDLTEQLPVDQLERFMNYYLSEMSAIVFDAHGTLDKYIGDAIMTFWNAPLDQPDHALRACQTAIRMKQREDELRPILKEMGAGAILTRIGINTGKMKVGNYGSLQKLNYTALGDGVNLASRLEGANKIYGSQILVAQPTVELAREKFLFRRLDLLRVKGKKKPMAVYELMAEGAGDASQQKLASEFERALAAYQRQNWDESEEILVALSGQWPQDGPIQSLLKRVRGFRASPPPTDWDGVHIAKDK